MSDLERKENPLMKRLSRRKSLAVFGAAAATAGVALSGCAQEQQAAPGAAAPQQTFHWKMQSTWTSGDYHHHNPTVWVDRVVKATGGRITIDLEPAGSIVPAFEVLDAVHSGVLDAGNSWAGYWTGKDMAFGLFASAAGGPYGMDALDYLGWMYTNEGMDLYQGLFDELGYNVQAFVSYPEVPEPMGWFKQEIKSWDDFRGLKFRAGGLTAEVMKEAGMTVVILPGGEIVPSGEKGVIDAAEFSDPTSDKSLGFQDVWKFYHLPGIHQPTGHMECLINKAKWNELPADLQEIIRNVSQATTIQTWCDWLMENVKDLRALEEEHGVTVVRTPEDVLTEVLKGWDKVAARLSAENPRFAKVLESQKRFASGMVPFRRRAHPDYAFAAGYYWGV